MNQEQAVLVGTQTEFWVLSNESTLLNQPGLFLSSVATL